MRKKQFDLSDIFVDARLQGVHLASFQKRVVAFALDWGIIMLASRFSWFWFLVAVAWLFFRNQLNMRWQQSKKGIHESITEFDMRLQFSEIDPKIRQKFISYTKIYIYAMMSLFVLTSIGVFFGLIIGAFYVDEWGIIRHMTKEESFFLQPVQGLANLFDFLEGAIGAILYFSLFTWRWQGQTPGKRLMGIRIIKLNGQRIKIWNAFERVSGYVSSASLFLTGFFQYFWDKNHQTTHDKICETIVIDADSLPENLEISTLINTDRKHD